MEKLDDTIVRAAELSRTLETFARQRKTGFSRLAGLSYGNALLGLDPRSGRLDSLSGLPRNVPPSTLEMHEAV